MLRAAARKTAAHAARLPSAGTVPKGPHGSQPPRTESLENNPPYPRRSCAPAGGEGGVLLISCRMIFFLEGVGKIKLTHNSGQ